MSSVHDPVAPGTPLSQCDTHRLVKDGQDAGYLQSGQTCRIEPRTGAAFVLAAGDVLDVTDPMGEQVSDLFCFAIDDPGHRLSSGRTIDYANRIFLRAGDTLFSNRSAEMMRIVEDASGGHDFLLTPCSQEMFGRLYGIHEPRPSCFGNLAKNVAAFGIDGDWIGTTLNIFMNVRPDADTGELTIATPTSVAGTTTRFEALMPLIVGLTACSAENSNNGTFKPIDFTVHAAS